MDVGHSWIHSGGSGRPPLQLRCSKILEELLSKPWTAVLTEREWCDKPMTHLLCVESQLCFGRVTFCTLCRTIQRPCANQSVAQPTSAIKRRSWPACCGVRRPIHQTGSQQPQHHFCPPYYHSSTWPISGHQEASSFRET